MSWSHVPVAHAPQTVAPAALYVPAAHDPQLAEFVVVEYVPATHALHVRFVVALPAAVTYCSAAQLAHAWHAVAALASWSYVPVAQAAHPLVVPVHAVDVYACPAAQFVAAQFWHAVTGLLSWS